MNDEITATNEELSATNEELAESERHLQLLVFTFDNVTGQIFVINEMNRSYQELIKLDSTNRLKIRNACFWGVASGK